MIDQQWAFLKDVAELIQYADRLGYKLTGGELWRSPETEKSMVEEGKSETLHSMHIERLAIDLNCFDSDGNLIQMPGALGSYWSSLSPGANRWGGTFETLRDYGHFERQVNSG